MSKCVKLSGRPYAHSKDVFYYWRFVNRNKALASNLNLKVFKLIRAHLFWLSNTIFSHFYNLFKKISLRTPVQFNIFSVYTQYP